MPSAHQCGASSMHKNRSVPKVSWSYLLAFLTLRKDYLFGSKQARSLASAKC